MYLIKRTGNALGDFMMAAFFVKLLNDNGIEAKYHKSWYADLVNVDKGIEGIEFYFDYSSNLNPYFPVFDKTKSIIELVSGRFKNKFNIKEELKILTPYVPVNYTEHSDIRGVDVSLCTKSGVWSKYRDWPFFNQLKHELAKRKISFIDLTQNRIFNNTCLNYVKKSKVYVGLETGTSHYVPQVANNGIIIQSGYSFFDY